MLDPVTHTEARRLFFKFFRSLETEVVPEEQEFLSRAESSSIEVLGGKVSTWSWGKGENVLLVHGLYGRAGQLRAFVGPLVEAGFRVTAFDAPGHGASPSPYAFHDLAAHAIVEIDRHVGGLYGAVAHCGGASWVGYAFEHGLRVERLAVLSAAGGRVGIDGYVNMKKVPEPVAIELAKLVEAFEGRNGWEIGCVPKNVRSWSAAGLVVHDEDDRFVPLADARAIAEAWPGAKLMVTQKLGHVGVLTSDVVVNAVASFLRTGDVGDPS